MNRLVKILMQRDGMSKGDAEEILEDARDRLKDGDDPEDILREEFGLELDYVFDLIP